MTCIVGLIDKDSDTIYMGGDSAGVAIDDYFLVKRKDPKVFLNGDFIIGYTGSFRMGQLLRFKFKPEKKEKDMDAYEYMCTIFVDDLRRTLKDGGFAKIDNNVEEGGSFLVGYQGNLFDIEDDFQVGMYFNNYMACGCGRILALGSLYSTKNFNMDSYDRVKLALEASSEFNACVNPPFVIEKLKRRNIFSGKN